MSPDEHRRVAAEFLDVSDEEFERGDNLQASEKLWGAAAHAVMAVAQAKGWSYRSHQALRYAAKTIADVEEDPKIVQGFIEAENFHKHFYHGNLEDIQRDRGRPYVHQFVSRVLSVSIPD